MQTVYEVMDIADSAYLLQKGKLTFELSPRDRYTVEGKEIIFGAEELLIASKSNNREYFRFQTVLAEDEALIKKSQQYTLESVPPRNKFIPVVAMASNPHAIPLLWDWYVNNLEEMTQMMSTMRAFEAYQKVIQAIDGLDDQAANNLGRIG